MQLQSDAITSLVKNSYSWLKLQPIVTGAGLQ